ncbi:MAG: AI-2E family transporter [Patescibacteria group bacterium]
MEKTPLKKVEVSHRTIVFTVVFLSSLWFLYEIRQIVVGLFVSIVLMSAINPLLDKMEKVKIPRALGIIFVYIFIIGLLGLVVAGIIPPLVEQTSRLISGLPDFIKKIEILGDVDKKIIENQLGQLSSLPGDFLKFGVAIFSNFIAIFAFLIITFYMLLERKNLNRYLYTFFGERGEEKAERIIAKMEEKLGGWVRAEILLMLIIGVSSYIGLRVIGLEYALPLAILAGLLELIPNIGPVVAAIPAVLIGFSISPLTALVVAVFYFLIQQIENSLIVPQIMSKRVGVNPLITIISLAIGFKIGGVLGAILAVPVVLLIEIIFNEVLSFGKTEQSS